MSAHTPGPWRVIAHGEALYQVEEHTHTESSSVHSDYGAANARLIAASPDLLEALRAIVDADFFPGAWTEHYELLAKKARAAINKATGEPS